MPSTPVDAHLDLSDPDLLADHLPLDEFAWLRRNEPIRWNPQDSVAAYGDAGFWALTRHVDVAAVTRSLGWSVEANSAFVRRLDPSDPTGESTKNLLLCMDPPRHTRGVGWETGASRRVPSPAWRTICASRLIGSFGRPSVKARAISWWT